MTHTPGRVRLLGDDVVLERDEQEVIAWVGDVEGQMQNNARRIAALWNAAERLGLKTEAIENGEIEKAFRKLEELELMIERGELK